MPMTVPDRANHPGRKIDYGFPSAPHSGVDALLLNSRNEDGSVRTSGSPRYGNSNPTAQREITSRTSD